MYFHFKCRNECCVWGGCAAAVQCLASGFPPVTGWNNILVFIFCDIDFVLQALLNTSPPGWTAGRENWSHEVAGERRRIPCLCCFFLCCQWLRGRLLLTGEFGCGSAELLIPAEPFFSLSISWWNQSQTCRTCSQQKVFCCLPCPLTAFIVLIHRFEVNYSVMKKVIFMEQVPLPLTALLCWLYPCPKPSSCTGPSETICECLE